MTRNNLTQVGFYYLLQTHGRTHILVENTNRDFEAPDYMNTGLALKGVTKQGQSFEDWLANRRIL